MVLDLGLSFWDIEEFLEVCGVHVDIVMLGWGTSYVTAYL
jgi:phosphosulfolactate synthase